MNFLTQISQGFALCRESLEFWVDIIRKPNDAIDYELFHVPCLDVFYDGLGRLLRKISTTQRRGISFG